MSLHSLSGSSSVEWIQGSLVAQKQPLTWFKVTYVLTLSRNSLWLFGNVCICRFLKPKELI